LYAARRRTFCDKLYLTENASKLLSQQTDRPTDRQIERKTGERKKDKKFELMLMRLAKAYNSSGSVV